MLSIVSTSTAITAIDETCALEAAGHRLKAIPSPISARVRATPTARPIPLLLLDMTPPPRSAQAAPSRNGQ